MAELSHADIQQLYDKCLMIHKGVLVKIVNFMFNNPVEVELLNLSTGKKLWHEFNTEDFSVPAKRIGYVNIMQSAVFVSRVPVRRYHLGINANNIHLDFPKGGAFIGDKYRVKDKIVALNCKEIYMAYSGQYPDMMLAYQQAKEWLSCCAFDKQFAVDAGGKVFYKDQFVGMMNEAAIDWNEGYQYLETALGNNYEKTAGTFKATTL